MKTISAQPRPVLFANGLIVVACFFMTATAGADTFGRARPGIFASINASHGFKVLSKHATGVLFSLDDDGKEQVIWNERLVNVPVRAFVAPNGKRVVTTDTHADLGREHSLVIYDDKGKILGDYRLEDLLSEQEIRDRVPQTSPNRWWTDEASFRFRYDGRDIKYFDITLKWGKIITVNLHSGKLHRPPNETLNRSDG